VNLTPAVKVAVATPGQKQWTMTMTGRGPRRPDISLYIEQLKSEGHTVGYARTTNESGRQVVDHLKK